MNTESLYDYSHWEAYGFPLPIQHIRNVDVKHDIDLVRLILIQLRDKPDLKPSPVRIDGYEPVLVARHVMRLHDAGLVEGSVHRSLGMEAPLVFATDLSLEGHSFLGALESKDVWSKLKEVLSPEEMVRLPIKKLAEIAVDLGVLFVRRKLGLDG
ncbi:DUF2513 domain-containing protein [Agrobacterium pusense]|uniref:DUF2513 domain-containing protein n=1 Tax=Agrobacterium pusense TaxID=648995 RepID=UPI00146D4704|nr:DUF2513 domain-containing protein [Agrobacterium pusense]WCK24607.1 DUF2513 domain-containing protein [Agrobacterium pusense]